MDNFNQNQNYGQPNQGFGPQDSCFSPENNSFGPQVDNYGQQNGGFGQGGFGPQNGGFNQPPMGVNSPNYTLYLVLSIILILGICCCNIISLILGIIAIVTLMQANDFFKMGNMMMYEDKIRTTKILILVGYGLIVAGIVLNIAVGTFSTIASWLSWS
jgi:hypothetical protein